MVGHTYFLSPDNPPVISLGASMFGVSTSIFLLPFLSRIFLFSLSLFLYFSVKNLNNHFSKT